ncbi:hypothetical protein ACHHV8_04095 [Paenibacillus sp. TAB 01]|uniref:hypothetical protein n=1 Tax=Paenibacillus sp. TAB 01 TaxID=3368988 RepID=UPI0037520BF5
MLHNGIYFHNVTELEPNDGLPGWTLHRFPKEVRHHISEKGRWKAVQSNGCELRFVTDAKHVRVTVASQETNGRVFVFRGTSSIRPIRFNRASCRRCSSMRPSVSMM